MSDGMQQVAERSSLAARFLGRFTVLKGAPRELWVIFGVHLTGYVSYQVMNMTFVLWLTYNFGCTDEQATSWVFYWSALMTLVTVFVGSFTDAIGVRKALLLSLYVCIAARVVMTFVTVKWVAIGLGMLPVAVGEALGTPAMVAATRRFSTTRQRSIAFSLFYASMNVGFLIAVLLFDFIRRHVGDRHGQFVLPLLDIQLTSYRTLLLVSLVFQCALFPLLYFGLREGVEATDDGVRIAPRPSKYLHEAFLRSLWLTLRDTLRETSASLPNYGANPTSISSWGSSRWRRSCA